MKTKKFYLTIFLSLLFLSFIIIAYISNHPHPKQYLKVDKKRTAHKRVVGSLAGSVSNNTNVIYEVDLIENQFVYKIYVTNDGRLRLQIDSATVSENSSKGPLYNMSSLGDGDTSAGSYNVPDGVYNSVTLVAANYPNTPSSTTGSGANCTIIITNKIVTSFTVQNAGINYSVGDTLTLYFALVDSSGNQTQVSSNSLFIVKVKSIQPATAINPALAQNDWVSWTTVREYGANALYGAGEFVTNPSLSTNGQYRNYKNPLPSTPGICLTLGDVQQQWFCIMDEISIYRENTFKNTLLFSTTKILATTSEIDDFRVFHLCVTYRGLGILAAPRGAQITVDLYELGYADLFDDIAHARCGDTNSDDPYFGKLGLPGLGITAFSAYPCRYGCASIVPASANPYDDLIWEMASSNGLFRLQFFDSGHFRFVANNNQLPIEDIGIKASGKNYQNGTRIVPLYRNSIPSGALATITVSSGQVTAATIVPPTTSYAANCNVGDILTIQEAVGSGCVILVDRLTPHDPPMFGTAENAVTGPYPQCGIPGVGVIVNPSTKNLEARKDCWIIRGITYYDKNLPSGMVNMSCLDLMVSVTDSGALIMQKDYRYSTPNNQVSHVMTYTAIGYTGTGLPGNLQADPLLYSQSGVVPNATYANIVGNAPPNDSKNYHWNLMNSLACYGPDLASKWEYANGTIIATTLPFVLSQYAPYDNGLSKIYTLWMSPMGIRLFRTSGTVRASDLSDYQNCLWITPFSARGWYRGGDTNANLYTSSNYCRNGIYYKWPLPTSNDTTGQWAGQGNRVGNPFLQTCGQFQVPIPQVGETAIVSLFSTNRRYVFRFMTSGRCIMYDTASYSNGSTASILYDCCNTAIGGYSFSPVNSIGNPTC